LLEGREIFRLVIPLRDRLITKLAGGSPANCGALRSGFGPSITIFLPRRTRKTPIVVDNTIIYWQPIVTNRSMVKNGRQVGGKFSNASGAIGMFFHCRGEVGEEVKNKRFNDDGRPPLERYFNKL
jgi:hypothetical protein